MALWDKVRTELDRAGRVAQAAIDEGRVRLEAMRARELADKAAQALGYAVYRARQAGGEVDAESYARLSSTLASHEAEAKRLEEKLADASRKRAAEQGDRPGAGDRAASSSTSDTEPPQPPSPSAPPPPPEAPGWGDTPSPS